MVIEPITAAVSALCGSVVAMGVVIRGVINLASWKRETEKDLTKLVAKVNYIEDSLFPIDGKDGMFTTTEHCNTHQKECNDKMEFQLEMFTKAVDGLRKDVKKVEEVNEAYNLAGVNQLSTITESLARLETAFSYHEKQQQDR